MNTRYERHSATVAKVLEAGEGSKAFIKTGMEALSYLYDMVREDFNNETKYANCWDVPYSLAHIRAAKHETVFGEYWNRVNELVEMRDAIKALPILVRQPKEEGLEQKIRRTILEEITARKEKFDIAKRIVELFGVFTKDERGLDVVLLPVSVHHVYCRNYFGTHWIRIDWYLSGEKTPLNTIMAAADQVKREQGK